MHEMILPTPECRKNQDKIVRRLASCRARPCPLPGMR